MGKIGLLDLEKQFAFYGVYRINKINVCIHMLLVWPIYFTFILLLDFTPSLFNLPPVKASLFQNNIILVFNLGFIFTLIYSFYYIALDLRAGTFAAFLCFGSWIGTSYLATRLGICNAWKVVLMAQVVCWSGQFIGHGVFQKRSPGFVDDVLQAFLMAPFFVLLEALQRHFGYEPYPGFHAAVRAKITEINELQAKKEYLLR